jgi:hypothetical protein
VAPFTHLPGAFYAERVEVGGFAVGEDVLDYAVDAAATRAAAEAGAEFIQVRLFAMDYHFHIAIFGVADPAAEVELAGFAVNVPAEAYTLYAAFDQEVENHCE